MTHSNVTIITPCFNENSTLIAFLKELDQVLNTLPYFFTVIVIDDASTDNTLNLLKAYTMASTNTELKILTLRYNQGHQGAIYQGILYALHLDCDKFIIMDSDGEDDPEAIKELVTYNNYDIINVVRGRRKESFSFKLAYYIYRFIFRIVTGRVMNFGNFCMINKRVITTSSYTAFVHFAAHLSKQRVRSKQITYDRRKRIDGKSKMNTTSLVHHAFKSFVEYAEDLLMIFLKMFAGIALVFFLLILFVLYKKLFTNDAIMGWASTLSVGLFNTGIMCLGFFVLGILLLNIMSKRYRNMNEPLYKEVEKEDNQYLNKVV
jgi:glycosyltransferase involved in cell wall biosynthesis